MQIFVKPGCGRMVPIRAEPETTIGHLKRELEQHHVGPAHMQRLMCMGKNLGDDRTLESYNIQKEATIYLLLAQSVPEMDLWFYTLNIAISGISFNGRPSEVWMSPAGIPAFSRIEFVFRRRQELRSVRLELLGACEVQEVHHAIFESCDPEGCLFTFVLPAPLLPGKMYRLVVRERRMGLGKRIAIAPTISLRAKDDLTCQDLVLDKDTVVPKSPGRIWMRGEFFGALVDVEGFELACVEMEVLRQVNHPHVLRALHFCPSPVTISGHEYALVATERPKWASVRELLLHCGKFSSATACAFALQLCSGLQYLHARGVLLHALSTNTVAITEANTVAIRITAEVQIASLTAPMAMLASAADVHCFGHVLAAMFDKRPSSECVMGSWDVPNPIAEIVASCVRCDAETRPSLNDVRILLDSYRASLPKEEPFPSAFVCSITMEPMHDPAVCEDGMSYERMAIERWLATHNTSPNTGRELSTKKLTPNIAPRIAICSLEQGAATSPTRGSSPICPRAAK